MTRMDQENRCWRKLLQEELLYVLDVLNFWREMKDPCYVSREHIFWIEQVTKEAEEF